MHERAFVIEGANSCFDLIRQRPQAIVSLTLSSRYLQDENEAERRIRSKLAAHQFSCSNAVFEKLSDVEAPQGVLAVVRQPQWDVAKILKQSRVLGIYGDQLRDPANVGTIIRTAAALNLTGVWFSCDSVDHFSSKVVRATAGAVLALPIFRVQDIRMFSEHNCSIYSALVPSPETIALRSIREIPRRLIIAVGNEGRGLSPHLVKASDVRFSIPLARGVESLNVAATVAISAFYFSDLPTEP
ncbi:MAG: RNA methyltransferase [Nitrospirae bacterium]|nr:RNA methyltransferase [Nitrospirota bacterium]